MALFHLLHSCRGYLLLFSFTFFTHLGYAELPNLSRPKPDLIAQDVIKQKATYDKYHGKISVPLEKSLAIEFTFYKSKVEPDKLVKPLVIIFANIAGISPIETFFARFFASNGMHVVISHSTEHENTTKIEETNESAMRTLFSGLSLIDHFETVEGIDKERIALLGISFGGIRGFYQMGFDPRVKAGAFIVSGGPIQHIMAYSKQVVAQRIRKAQMKVANIKTVDDYLQYLNENISLDLQEALKARSPDDFYLFISRSDSWVPTHYQWYVWSSIGQPKFEKFLLGHLTTPIWVSLTRKRCILDFYNDRFNKLAEEKPKS